MAHILVDTGIQCAIADADDRWHESAESFLRTNLDVLTVPVTVLPEACYLLNTYLGRQAEHMLLTSESTSEDAGPGHSIVAIIGMCL